MRLATIAAVLALLTTACATGPSGHGLTMQRPEGYVSLARAQDKEIQWSRARVVRVALVDVAFSPDKLTFDAGVPYRLIVQNEGLHGHDFVSPGFFEAIATKRTVIKTNITEKTFEFPFIESVDLAPNETQELLFVPVRRGTYELVCSYPQHISLGMQGKITVR